MFERTSTGYQGGTTIRIGDSTLTIGGTLARRDIARLRGFLRRVDQAYQTAGYPGVDDEGDGDDEELESDEETAGILDDIARGAGTVRDLANSPIGVGIASAAGPYGAAALAAANGVPAALDLLKQAGVDPEHARQVAEMHHPDARVRQRADARAANVKRAADQGDPKARALLAGLRKALVAHLRAELAEKTEALAACRQRLAAYGDPVAYAPLHAERLPMPPAIQGLGGRIRGAGARAPARAFDSGAAPILHIPPTLTDALMRALARARAYPEPSFRSAPLRRRA